MRYFKHLEQAPMAALTPPICDFGRPAVDFSLPGVDNKTWTLAQCAGEKGVLVMFICNHCPYVKAIKERIVRDTDELKPLGINSVAIMSNDPNYDTEDSFDNMQQVAKTAGFNFPYLWDETQQVAKDYGAICTPDFFGFNADLQLQYRGRLDDSGMQKKPDANRDLFTAMCQIARTGQGPKEQIPSIGCSIKWRAD